MALIVKKFGGTSVGDISQIRNVAFLIKTYKEAHPEDSLVIVLSAMAGETDKLVSLAKSCVHEPSARELDVLMATGEQVTIALLAMALIELGIPAKSFIGNQVSISTDSNHTAAEIVQINPKRVQDSLNNGIVAIVAGFQGIDSEGDITTLGRGGSDITAVAIASQLKASACYIYTDVEGIFTANPRICSKAQLLSKISHEEMLEMASLGAKVLHPRSVYFAMKYGVPLVVLSTFNTGSGTWVVKEEDLMEKALVTGITQKLDEAKITISGFCGGIHSLSNLFAKLEREGIPTDMITQTGIVDDKTSISFTVPDEQSSSALEIAESLIPEIGAEGAYVERDIAKVSVIGAGMRHHTQVAAKMFDALAALNIEVEMITTSEIKISVVVSRKYCEPAVRALHKALVEN